MAGLVLHDAAEDDFGKLLKATLESDIPLQTFYKPSNGPLGS